MGIVIRQGFKFIVVTYVGVALGALNILFLFPKFLAPSEIGLRELLVGIALMLSYFAQMAMNNVLLRFFPYFKDDERQHNGLFLLALLVSLVGYLAISGLFYAFTPLFTRIFEVNADLLVQYRGAILPLTAFILLNTLLEQWARFHLRIAQPALFRELILRGLLTISVVLYGTEIIDFDEFIWLFVVSYAINTQLLWWYVGRLGVLYLNPKYLKIPQGLRPEMLKYAAWMLLGGMGVIINERIDGLMLAWLAGISATGVYAISFFIANIIEMPRRGISQIAGALVATYWKQNNMEQMGKLYKQSGLNQLLLGGFLFVGIWSNIDGLFLLIPKGDIYSPGKYVVLLIGLARLIDMSNGINTEIIQNSPYYRFNLISILFLGIISFATNYIMIPKYGLVGAAAGSTISVMFFNLLKGGFIWWKLRLVPFEKRILGVVLLLFVAYGLAMLMPSFGTNWREVLLTMAFRSLIIGVVIVASVWRFKLSDELHELITTHLINRLPFKRTS